MLEEHIDWLSGGIKSNESKLDNKIDLLREYSKYVTDPFNYGRNVNIEQVKLIMAGRHDDNVSVRAKAEEMMNMVKKIRTLVEVRKNG